MMHSGSLFVFVYCLSSLATIPMRELAIDIIFNSKGTNILYIASKLVTTNNYIVAAGWLAYWLAGWLLLLLPSYNK
jgi:hypothetical protein